MLRMRAIVFRAHTVYSASSLFFSEKGQNLILTPSLNIWEICPFFMFISAPSCIYFVCFFRSRVISHSGLI